MTDTARQERLEEILLTYVEAAEAGAAPERKAFLAAHPDFADDIADFLAGYHQVNRLATPLRDSDVHAVGIEAIRVGAKRSLQAPSTEAPGTTGEAPGELGQLGDYRLLREIGRGGMGVVYEAEQISLRRRVALKILPFAGAVDARQLQRFRNEAEAAAHLHHSHIVPVFAVGAERGVHFYAMQHIEGQSLAALIGDLSAAAESGVRPALVVARKAASGAQTQTVGGLSTEHSVRSKRFFRTVATMCKDIAEALEYAHQMGVVHRDVKPANLLLDAAGHVWITDFGLAQFQSQVGLTMSGEVLGTLRYVSPEQAMAKRGLVDHRTDIYSLGATLYELLTLRPVFNGKDRHALLHQIGFDEPAPPRSVDPSIPVELETIVLKALAKHPADRYASAQELADDLRRFLDDEPILAKRPTLLERARKWGRRHPSFVAAGLLLLLFGLVALGVSTVLIARQQSQTNAALERQKIEEKNAREAYKKLAIEQERTEAALKAAERDRVLAELDFAQAKRAVDLVVQFSEGELAHHPAQEDVRRRLLLTVLDYYEDFLAQHADDKAAQEELAAGRERVAFIVTELSSLRGTSLIAIMQDAAVQKDLGIAPEQKKQIEQLVSKLSKEFDERFKGGKFTPKDKAPSAAEAAAAVERAFAGILSPAQKERFQQIALQVQQQSRNGFTSPKVVEALKLTGGQRERIRKLQAEAHQTWAEHLFTPRKLDKPAEFWAGVQEDILTVLDLNQREKWERLTGATIVVDLREGFPFDGKNKDVKLPMGPWFDSPAFGRIAVMQDGRDHAGSGFGHKVMVDSKQCYSWAGKEIPPTVFEIAVTSEALSEEERRHLLTKEAPAPETAGGTASWFVLFRSGDPSVWNTDSPDMKRFAVPVHRAPKDARYVRLKRVDTGEMQIVRVTHAELAQAGKAAPDQDFVWNGAANLAWGGRHLGIAEVRPLEMRRDKDGPRKDSPRKGPRG